MTLAAFFSLLFTPRRKRIADLRREREALENRIYHRKLLHREWKPLQARLRDVTNELLKLETR